MKDHTKILSAIDKIEEELYNKYKRRDLDLNMMPTLSVLVSSIYLSINISIASKNNYIPEINLWNSDNDDRIYYEKSDRYETFYKLIKRKFREIKNEINEVKL